MGVSVFCDELNGVSREPWGPLRKPSCELANPDVSQEAIGFELWPERRLPLRGLKIRIPWGSVRNVQFGGLNPLLLISGLEEERQHA